MLNHLIFLAGCLTFCLLPAALRLIIDCNELGFTLLGAASACGMFVTTQTGHHIATFFFIVLFFYAMTGLVEWTRDPVERKKPHGGLFD